MAEFFAMDGYGPYIWPAYGLSFLVLGLLGALSVHRRRRTKAEIARLEAMKKGAA